jgi:peroxiredoxin
MHKICLAVFIALVTFSCEEKKKDKAIYDENQTVSEPKKEEKVEAGTGINVGDKAPEIALPDPTGKIIALSSLRGKYVLIDFWSSWCGPCRRENPNVVKMYQTYKDKGFEIFGVSLDMNKEQWLQAIEQDGLTWTHVSDLGYWNSVVVPQYQISGIPATFLLDKEGKIIARDLRGAELEAKLKEVLK